MIAATLLISLFNGYGGEAYRNSEGHPAAGIRLPRTELHGPPVGKSSTGNGIALVAHVKDGNSLLQRHVVAEETPAFDLPVGNSKAGDTVHAGAGPWIKICSDAFQSDYSILEQTKEANP